MIRAIAIDDEPPALRVLENFCSEVDFIRLLKTFTRPNEALDYLLREPADLIFLDIQMPSISGLELYKSLGQSTMVIFTTAHSEYAVEGFNLSAVDYLLKPFTRERFVQAVQKAREHYSHLQHAGDRQIPPPHLLIRADYSLIRVPHADILFVEGLDDYLRIHLQNGRNIVARMTMKHLLSLLPAADFARVHRSFIVALGRIERIRGKVITVSGRDIPVGRMYEDDFLARFDIPE